MNGALPTEATEFPETGFAVIPRTAMKLGLKVPV